MAMLKVISHFLTSSGICLVVLAASYWTKSITKILLACNMFNDLCCCFKTVV
ncbi:unnamed protein product [Musa hybrid cultivar]